MKQPEGVKKMVMIPIEESEGLKDLQRRKLEAEQPAEEIGDTNPATIETALSKLPTALKSVGEVLLKVLKKKLTWNKDGDLISQGKVFTTLNIPELVREIATDDLIAKMNSMTGGGDIDEEEELEETEAAGGELTENPDVEKKQDVPPPPGEPPKTERKRTLEMEEEIIPKSIAKVTTSRWKTLT